MHSEAMDKIVVAEKLLKAAKATLDGLGLSIDAQNVGEALLFIEEVLS